MSSLQRKFRRARIAHVRVPRAIRATVVRDWQRARGGDGANAPALACVPPAVQRRNAAQNWETNE